MKGLRLWIVDSGFETLNVWINANKELDLPCGLREEVTGWEKHATKL